MRAIGLICPTAIVANDPYEKVSQKSLSKLMYGEAESRRFQVRLVARRWLA
jgi:hypothetical protein